MITKYKKLSLRGIVFGVVLIVSIGFIGITNGITKGDGDISNNDANKVIANNNEKITNSITITLTDNMEALNNPDIMKKL